MMNTIACPEGPYDYHDGIGPQEIIRSRGSGTSLHNGVVCMDRPGIQAPFMRLGQTRFRVYLPS